MNKLDKEFWHLYTIDMLSQEIQRLKNRYPRTD